MIPYEDLCHALDRYNRRLRGEPVEEPAQAIDDAGFDIVEEAQVEVEIDSPAFEAGYDAAPPDITAETEIGEQMPPPTEGYVEGQYSDPAYLPGEGAEQQYAEQEWAEQGMGQPGQPVEGMTAEQASSGQQAQVPYPPAGPEGYPEGYPDQDAYPQDAYPQEQQPAPDSGQAPSAPPPPTGEEDPDRQ